MEKRKVLLVFGTRPEAIKMAPLYLELKKCPALDTKVLVTAQHRDMLDDVLSIFNITPDFDLDIMQKSQTLSSITTKALLGLEGVLESESPDLLLVHGDTSTTFAGALAAFYRKIPVGHVEAGLRTGDKYSPYPEEMNRKLVSCIAELHFAPTAGNKQNLLREDVKAPIYVTGNTVIDALSETVDDKFTFRTEGLSALDPTKRLLLVTAHRRENYGEGLENICLAIGDIAREFPDTQVVYPVHPSPAVRETAEKYLADVPRVLLVPPVMVDEMHNLMARAYLVLTDSGGLQEEAPALGKPVLVLRRETERPEAVEAGTVALAGVERASIAAMAADLLRDKAAYRRMATAVNPYGDGHASARIRDAILHHFGLRPSPPREFAANPND
ncbi:UDP-N-acetylglucosamine 2-epimerase (non-hydrolyzing) [Oscillospiraceae bacterium OttesenSCG-928-G22]|nr:UDP-N-acetylglucosamine 2-epimerase (non-hydrolyzing) [Oscillospiraceae bacterium OttesenSCG-928-G22]